MKVAYDPEVDALSIVFHEAPVTTQEWAEGIVGEYDAQGRLAGIEILDASRRIGDPAALYPVVSDVSGGVPE